MSVLKGIIPDELDAQLDKALEGKENVTLANLADGKYVDKEKADRVSRELKQLKTDKAAVDSELATLKSKGLTDDEKLQQALDAAAENKKQYTVALNKLKAEKVFASAGLKEEDYSDLLDGLVSDDEESTLAKVNSISTLLSKQKTETEKALKAQLLKDTPAPDGGVGGEKGGAGESIGSKIAKASETANTSAQTAREQFFK